MVASRKEHLLDTAISLFERNGFRATGIDKILDAAKVAKMTLYNHFRSKEELILAAVRRRDEQWRNTFMRSVESRTRDPKERLLAVFDLASEVVSSDDFCGCFFARAASEYREIKDPIHAAANENKRLVTNYLTQLAGAAGAREPEKLAINLCMLLDGAVAYAFVSGMKEATQLARASAEVLIDEYLAPA
jgi:AcrR family transcriptional regulator